MRYYLSETGDTIYAYKNRTPKGTPINPSPVLTRSDLSRNNRMLASELSEVWSDIISRLGC